MLVRNYVLGFLIVQNPVKLLRNSEQFIKKSKLIITFSFNQKRLFINFLSLTKFFFMPNKFSILLQILKYSKFLLNKHDHNMETMYTVTICHRNTVE